MGNKVHKINTQNNNNNNTLYYINGKYYNISDVDLNLSRSRKNKLYNYKQCKCSNIDYNNQFIINEFLSNIFYAYRTDYLKNNIENFLCYRYEHNCVFKLSNRKFKIKKTFNKKHFYLKKNEKKITNKNKSINRNKLTSTKNNSYLKPYCIHYKAYHTIFDITSLDERVFIPYYYNSDDNIELIKNDTIESIFFRIKKKV